MNIQELQQVNDEQLIEQAIEELHINEPKVDIVTTLYKITSSSPLFEEAYTYYGSTNMKLNIRWSRHKSSYKSWLKGQTGLCKSFELFEKFGLDTCSIEMISIHNNITDKEKKSLEGQLIRNNVCINKCIPDRVVGSPEYIEMNLINMNTKITCECGIIHSNGNKTHHLKSKKHIQHLSKSE